MEYNEQKQERVILAGVHRGMRDALWDTTEESIHELGELVKTAGGIVVGEMIQNKADLESATYMGEGKLDELKIAIETLNADMVVFDDELSPVQMRNISDFLEIEAKELIIKDINKNEFLEIKSKYPLNLVKLTKQEVMYDLIYKFKQYFNTSYEKAYEIYNTSYKLNGLGTIIYDGNLKKINELNLSQNKKVFLNKILDLHKKLSTGREKIKKDFDNDKSSLTKREREIALLAQRGITTKEISKRLFISTETVKMTLKKVYRKLDVHSKAELNTVKF